MLGLDERHMSVTQDQETKEQQKHGLMTREECRGETRRVMYVEIYSRVVPKQVNYGR